MRHCHARRLALPLALFSALIMTICLPLCAQDLSSLRVAILDDDIPGLDRELVGLIAASITSHGARVTRLDADSLASDERFDRETHDALILTNSPRFPGKAAANVERFLQSGGHLVLLGGHAYSDPVCRVRGEWTNRDGYAGALAETPTEASLFSFDQGDLSGWRRGTNNAVHRSQAVPAPGVSGQCLRLEIEGLSRWQWTLSAHTWTVRRLPDTTCCYSTPAVVRRRRGSWWSGRDRRVALGLPGGPDPAMATGCPWP